MAAVNQNTDQRKTFAIDLVVMLDDMLGEGWNDKTLMMVRDYVVESYRQHTGERLEVGGEAKH